MTNKQLEPAAKRLPPAAGMGRKAGSRNKATKELKEAILRALDKAGGEDYLAQVAVEKPEVFCKLLALLVPRDQSDGSDQRVVVIHGGFGPDIDPPLN